MAKEAVISVTHTGSVSSLGVVLEVVMLQGVDKCTREFILLKPHQSMEFTLDLHEPQVWVEKDTQRLLKSISESPPKR